MVLAKGKSQKIGVHIIMITSIQGKNTMGE